ncbi:MAG: SPFH domain-containing protein [Coriobacteriales bacterium]|nr:SPFH domain-containing protein [Coriobacteriales bacterium]
MGLINAAKSGLEGVLADQWREYFYCESLSPDVLMCKGQKRIDNRRSQNTKGSDNLISNGSIIAVNDGQFMIIVQQGEIVEFCGEPGEFIWNSSTEPSMLTGLVDGELKDAILGSAKIFVRRFTAGGDTMKDQRVYYFNMKEIYGNKYGTASPIPYRVVDTNVGLDLDINILCNGEYSYMIKDPLLFYKRVCGNARDKFLRSEIDSQLKSELMTALQPAFARVSAMGIRYSMLPAKTREIAEALKIELSEDWRNKRGIEIYSFGVNSVKATEEDEKMIKEAQRAGIYRDPNMAAGRLVDAKSTAMVDAANNENAGGMMAFAGLNMASNAAGGDIAGLYVAGQQGTGYQPQYGAGQGYGAPQGQYAPIPGIGGAPAAAPAGWTCPKCGKAGNTGKFCMDCGTAKPAPAEAWTCSKCGHQNTGKFCMECGAPAFKGYKCDKCGWEPEDPKVAPKFCPNCGDIFDENDVK